MGGTVLKAGNSEVKVESESASGPTILVVNSCFLAGFLLVFPGACSEIEMDIQTHSDLPLFCFLHQEEISPGAHSLCASPKPNYFPKPESPNVNVLELSSYIWEEQR